jgi:hypothetical protein
MFHKYYVVRHTISGTEFVSLFRKRWEVPALMYSVYGAKLVGVEGSNSIFNISAVTDKELYFFSS